MTSESSHEIKDSLADIGISARIFLDDQKGNCWDAMKISAFDSTFARQGQDFLEKPVKPYL